MVKATQATFRDSSPEHPLKDFMGILERRYKIKVKNPDLLCLALKHSSLSKKAGDLDNNERLEFLGDAFLDTAISLILFKRFPSLREDGLSMIKSYLVSSQNLARHAIKLPINKFLQISPAMERTQGRRNEKLLSSAFEAVVGAIFLDRGFDEAFKFVEGIFKNQIKGNLNPQEFVDHKTRLHELVQKIYKIKPVYRVVSEKGLDHDKFFEVVVEVDGEVMGKGEGKNKKEAQQCAAKEALIKLKGLMEKKK